MSNDLVKVESKIDYLVDLQNTEALAQKLMATKHYSKMGLEGVYAVVHKAKALGVNPIDALNGGLYIVSGRVGMSTELMACLIRAQGHSITRDAKSTTINCILNGRRKDNGDTWSASFSIEDAKKAGLVKSGSPWDKYPDVMCYNRAMSKLARQLFPDIIKGAGYTHDELKEIAASKGITEEADFNAMQSIDAEVVKPIQTDCINGDQIEYLVRLLSQDNNETEAVSKLLTKCGCSSIEEIKSSKYEASTSWLSQRLAHQHGSKKEIEVKPTESIESLTTKEMASEVSVFD